MNDVVSLFNYKYIIDKFASIKVETVSLKYYKFKIERRHSLCIYRWRHNTGLNNNSSKTYLCIKNVWLLISKYLKKLLQKIYRKVYVTVKNITN